MALLYMDVLMDLMCTLCGWRFMKQTSQYFQRKHGFFFLEKLQLSSHNFIYLLYSYGGPNTPSLITDTSLQENIVSKQSFVLFL